MITISLGNKKKSFRSIKEAAAYAGINYMTMYMRIRMGKPVVQAVKQPVRKYVKRAKETV